MTEGAGQSSLFSPTQTRKKCSTDPDATPPLTGYEFFMKYFAILASFYSVKDLRADAGGLAIVACALLIGGFFVWRVTRFLKKDAAEELERERHGENIP